MYGCIPVPVEEINWDKQDLVKCDERGRATLGSEFANEQVLVWIAEAPDYGGEPVPGDLEDVLSNMLSWAGDQDFEIYDLHPETGEVEDKHGELHESPYSYDGEIRS